MTEFPASADEAISDLRDGQSIMFGGFVTAGSPHTLVAALVRKGTRGITGIANNIGLGDHLDDLCERRQLRKMITTFAIRASQSRQSRFEKLYRAGEVELELVPQGTLAERIRAGGAGLGGFLTKTGIGTEVAAGKQVVHIDGSDFLLEKPLRADVAFIKAHTSDRNGNLTFRGAARNFNKVMASAADLVIAEVEEIVPTGTIDPDSVVIPGIFVDRVVLSEEQDVVWHQS